MTWINDHCDNGRIGIWTERRARGILTLHATCEPPCPHKICATAYLAGASEMTDRTVR